MSAALEHQAAVLLDTIVRARRERCFVGEAMSFLDRLLEEAEALAGDVRELRELVEIAAPARDSEGGDQ